MECPNGHFQNRLSQSGGGVKMPSLFVSVCFGSRPSVMTFFSCKTHVQHRLTRTYYPSPSLQLSSLSPRFRMLSPSTFLFSPIYPHQSTLTRTPHALISYVSPHPFPLPFIHHLRDVAGIGLVDKLRWELWRTTRCHLSSHGPSF